MYRRLLEQEIAPSFRLRILTRLVDLYLSARKRSEAMPLLEEIARDYPEGPEAPRALYRIAQILWNRNDNQRALEYFNQLTERYPGAADADRALLAAASIYESQGKKAEAVALYNTIQARFPKSPARDAAAWRLAWLYYIGGDFKKASAVFKSLAGRAKDDSLRTASFYWHGRSAERLGAVESAKQSYHKILQAGDESYYHGLAARRLARLGIAVPAAKNGKSGSGSLDEAPAIPADIGFHLARARELTALNLDSLALVELDRASRLAGSEPALLRMLVREYAKTRSYARSLALANQLPQGLEERERHRFPLAYWDMIEEKARAHGLDPYLLLALIRQESLFDTRARSSASALGLMQLIPSTAARVAKQIGWSPPTTEGLFEPEINITLGAQYLKDLLERYGNDWHKAIAAYNAGEQAVDRWQKEIDSDDSEEFIERIPYLETRQYVKLVLRNHRIYKRLYERQ
ncbi:MAG TPA: transglycosylase SLT domain-containing protein [Candidatus Eisenbacteria bacterium]|nr:transglycosylase SLT domain-containing protein [Candidatus Eisenbacteria bacterium]